MTPEQAKGVRAVPVGTYKKKKRRQNPWTLPDREDWFLWFLMDCLDKMRQVAVPGLLQFNYDRLNLDGDNSTISSPEAEAYQHQVTTGNYPRPDPGYVTSLDVNTYDVSSSITSCVLQEKSNDVQVPTRQSVSSDDTATPPNTSATTRIPESSRKISLRDLLKSMLKSKNSGFTEYVKAFAEARGRVVWGAGHISGAIEGFFVWLGSEDKKIEDDKKNK